MRALVTRITPSNGSLQNPSHGFTLVELLVCIALMGLVFTIALPYAQPGFRAVRLSADARVLAAVLRSAREGALSMRETMTVKIDVGARGVFGPGPGDRTLLGSVDGIKVMTTKEVTSGVASIAFQPDGSSSGGAVTLSSGERSLRVSVDWLTGAISVCETPP